jgi:glycosyltransferase involved in cell wall biosynthesis
VIVPCYNQGLFLREAIKSLLRQTYPNWECIIIDDGSTDNSLDIALDIQKTDSRIKVFHQNNSGVSKARNAGILKSTGELIQFLDADDLLQYNKFNWTISILNRNPKTDLVVTDARYFEDGKKSLNLQYGLRKDDKEWIVPVWNESRPIIEKLLENNITPINSPIIRKKVIHRVGMFDENLQTMEDWNLWAKCAFTGASFYFESVPETYALIRIHESSVTNNTDLMYQGRFNHTINIGRYIKKTSHKAKNFSLGLLRLEKCKNSYNIRSLLKLLLSNLCFKNFITFILIMVKNLK